MYLTPHDSELPVARVKINPWFRPGWTILLARLATAKKHKLGLHMQKDIFHLERMQILKGLRGLAYHERLEDLKPRPLEKKKTKKVLFGLAHNILLNQIDLKTTQHVKFFRRLGLRRSSLRLLRRTGKLNRNKQLCMQG